VTRAARLAAGSPAPRNPIRRRGMRRGAPGCVARERGGRGAGGGGGRRGEARSRRVTEAKEVEKGIS